MDLQISIDQLNRRIETLRKTNVASFGESFRLFVNFLRSSPVFKPVLDEIAANFPTADSWHQTYVQGSQTVDLADLTPAEIAAVAIIGLSELRSVSKIRNNWGLRYSNLSSRRMEAHTQHEHDAGSLQLAKDLLLEPLYVHLLETVEAQRSITEEHHKNNDDEEWFSKEEKDEIERSLKQLREKLFEIADSSSENGALVARVKRIVTQQLEETSSNAEKLTKKDWKNHLITAIVGLMIMFAFSSEARITLKISYEKLVNIVYKESVLPDQLPLGDDKLLIDD